MNAIDRAHSKEEMELLLLKARMSPFFFLSRYNELQKLQKSFMNILEGHTDEIRSDCELWFSPQINSDFKKVWRVAWGDAYRLWLCWQYFGVIQRHSQLESSPLLFGVRPCRAHQVFLQFSLNRYKLLYWLLGYYTHHFWHYAAVILYVGLIQLVKLIELS